MKIIRLYLAGSGAELAEERLELAAYVESLNKLYVRRGIYFELTDANALGTEREEAIRDAQYFYVLFGRREDAAAVREFDAALAAFQQQNAPKLYTWFLQLPEGQSAAEGVRAFMERVDRELGHFYSVFSHIDSVKLNLVMELCRDPLVGGQVKLEDGQALVDGQAVLSMEHIPLYSKNETVQKLLAEKRRLDEEFAALASLGDSEPILRMRLERDIQRSKIAEQLHALEMDVLGLYAEVSEKRRLGARMNWREAKAIELVDAGDYEGAKALLRDKLWTEEVRHTEVVKETATERIREYIKGKRTLVKTLRATGVTPEAEAEIIAIYEGISALAEKHRIELDTLYEYASFLYDQNRFSKGIRVAERLWRVYDAEETPVDKRSMLLNLMGILYTVNHDFQKAEDLYRKSLVNCRCLAKGQSNIYELSVNVGAICNLAVLLADTGRHSEAETLYREALAGRRRLVDGQLGAYEPDVADTCNNLANC